MKERNVRKSVFLYICAGIFIFFGASPWEGAAAVAPAGELPETGFFIATNSYPKNTVVDITNIETNKSARVIVANTLDSPGLLAIVSREAAELIGMKPGIINRIKLVQPSEPVAYLRFKDGLDTGIPGYDSGNVITDETYRYESYMPPVVVTQEKTEPIDSGVRGPSYTLEPEWQNREIVDVPFFPPAIEPEWEEEPEYIAEDDPFFEEEIEEPEYIAEEELYYEEEIEEPEYIAEEEPYYEEEIEEPEYIAEEEPVCEEEIIEEPEYIAEPEQTEFTIVEAEERPPEGSVYGIDPADIIPGITRPPAEPEIPATPVLPEQLFSVPKLTQKGYYVQLAALPSTELFENTVNKIDRRYWPVVFDVGNNAYRVLLGPLNQGESAAVLQRFKSIGYNDAFVRHIR
jgi:cell division septation protein DedD